MMDGRRMDVEGGRVLHREKRARKLAAVVAVQNVLVVACLLATLYCYWGVRRQEESSEKNIHLEFGSILDIHKNQMLPFNHVESSYQMSAVGGQININCSGPYFLKMDVCYKCLEKKEKKELNGTLQLMVVGRKAPATSFNLTTSDEDCRGLDWIVYLRAEEQASLFLSAQQYFRITNATLSLTYLLGRQCQN